MNKLSQSLDVSPTQGVEKSPRKQSKAWVIERKGRGQWTTYPVLHYRRDDGQSLYADQYSVMRLRNRVQARHIASTLLTTINTVAGQYDHHHHAAVIRSVVGIYQK